MNKTDEYDRNCAAANSAEQGHVAAEAGEVTAEPRHKAAKLGHVAAETGDVEAESGHVAAKMGHVAAEAREVTVEPEHVAAESSHKTTEPEQKVTTPSCKTTELGQTMAAPEQKVAAPEHKATDSNVFASDDRIHIADEVLMQIIAIAAAKVKGVAAPSAGVGGSVAGSVAGLLGMKGSSRGIRIETDEKYIIVDISVAVDYGLKINETANALQETIRSDLTQMTGLDVRQVNVHVVSYGTKEQSAGKSPTVI